MHKYLVGFVALAAFLSVELIGATQADAQLFSRMRGRNARTQCCQVSCPTNTNYCGTTAVAASCVQPIVASPAVVSDVSCGDCGNAVVSAASYGDCGDCGTAAVSTCSNCCPRRGMIARTSYAAPVCGQTVGQCGQSGCVGGCGTMGTIVEGCVGGGCGGTVIEGEMIEGAVIEGAVIEGSEITAPVESGSTVPDPPAQAPEPTDADKAT